MHVGAAILPYLRPVRGWFTLTAASALVASALSVATAFSLSAAVSAMLELGDRPSGSEDAGLLLAVTVLLATARAVCLWGRDQFAMATAARVKRSVRTALSAKLYELGPGHPWKGGRGGIQTTVVDGAEHLQAYVGFYLPQLVVSWLVPAAVVVVLVFVDPVVGLVVAAGVLTVPSAQRLWRRLLRNRAQDHWEKYGRFANRLGDSIRGITSLIALGATQRRRARLSEAAEELRQATTANMRASLGVSAVMTSAMAIGTAGATLVAAVDAARGVLDVGAVLLVLFLAAEAFRPQQELSGYWHEGFYGIAAARGVAELLSAEPSVGDRPGVRPVELDGAPSLEVTGVSYRYPDSERPVLRNVSFSVPAGATLAVVGRSGAGKTTLGRLLLRDLDPDAGRVALAGVDLRDYPLAQLRRLTARVAQDVVLLSGSVRENVASAASAPQPALLERAIRDARLTELESVLAEGLDSEVGEGGRLLSGGQRQRVALARALVADARLLVLDEATSALDAENEGLITRVLDDQRGRRTTIVIAHRLSTVARADYVLVLDDGEVVEFGPPDELTAAGGAWAGLLAAQRRAVLAATSSGEGS